jgi:hypothetical protein
MYIFLLSGSCRPGPYIADYKIIKGYIIGKEICNADETKDYWLIDFTYGSNNPHVGDTLFFNGVTYNNVLKTSGLDPQLKTIGMRVTIDYRVISANKKTTTGCNVTTPDTYQLKELTILHQGEIR